MRISIFVIMMLCAVPSFAARVFTSGFETNDLLNTEWTFTSGTLGTNLILSTSNCHSGTYCLRETPSANTVYVYRSLGTSATTGTYFVRFYYRPDSLPASNQVIWSVRSSAGTNTITLTLNTSTGVVVLTNVNDSSTITSTATVTAAAWTRFEISFDVSTTATAGIELKMATSASPEGAAVSQGTLSGKITTGTNIRDFVFGNTSSRTALEQWDDIAINDNTGTFQTTYAGPGFITLAVPSSDVTVAWTISGTVPAATRFGGVNDEPGVPNNNVAFNGTATTSAVDKLGITISPSFPANTVPTLMDIYGFVGSTATSGTRTNNTIQVWDDGGVNTAGPVFTCAVSNTWKILTTAEHFPVSLSGKSTAAVASYDIGYKAGSSITANVSVTALWGNVEYTVSAVTSSVARRTVVIE